MMSHTILAEILLRYRSSVYFIHPQGGAKKGPIALVIAGLPLFSASLTPQPLPQYTALLPPKDLCTRGTVSLGPSPFTR